MSKRQYDRELQEAIGHKTSIFLIIKHENKTTQIFCVKRKMTSLKMPSWSIKNQIYSLVLHNDEFRETYETSIQTLDIQAAQAL